MAFILDSSVALSWVLPDEGGKNFDSLIDELVEDIAVVPGLWPLEIGNVLMIAKRRKRISGAEFTKAVNSLLGLPLEIDKKTSDLALPEILKIADRSGVTVYDAAYLELAARRKLALATLDRRLAAACKAFRIELIEGLRL